VALIVLDASVLVALLDPADARHAAATAALRRYAGDDLRVPASAYAECLAGPASGGRLAEAKRAIRSLVVEVVPITEDVAEEAAELRGRHPGLRLADALVVATAGVLDADVTLTADERWRDLSSSVEVVRPG
jgi:predicted nucleic acid-binding protein